jgi:hypothetical protein
MQSSSLTVGLLATLLITLPITSQAKTPYCYGVWGRNHLFTKLEGTPQPGSPCKIYNGSYMAVALGRVIYI